MIGFIDGLPNLVRMGSGQHLVNRGRGTRSGCSEERDTVTQPYETFAQQGDHVLDAAVFRWRYPNPRRSHHGDV
jgi:hypothetical protein